MTNKTPQPEMFCENCKRDMFVTGITEVRKVLQYDNYKNWGGESSFSLECNDTVDGSGETVNTYCRECKHELTQEQCEKFINLI